MGMETKPTIDERVERLEQLANRLIDLAAQHPVGRVILRKLGIE
jgi:hypothetical protein